MDEYAARRDQCIAETLELLALERELWEAGIDAPEGVAGYPV